MSLRGTRFSPRSAQGRLMMGSEGARRDLCGELGDWDCRLKSVSRSPPPGPRRDTPSAGRGSWV